MRGSQTLEDLHHAIFRAFERVEEHMYEFQIGGEKPMDPNARRYVISPAVEEEASDTHPAGAVHSTPVGSLGLKKGDVFGYWFDFGDDWWHQVNVVSIEERSERAKLPRVVKRRGASPPQYVDWDEEDE